MSLSLRKKTNTSTCVNSPENAFSLCAQNPPVTHHHDESTRGVKISSSRMEVKHVLEMDPERRCCLLGAEAVAAAPREKLLGHMLLPLTRAERLRRQV